MSVLPSPEGHCFVSAVFINARTYLIALMRRPPNLLASEAEGGVRCGIGLNALRLRV